MPPRRRGRPAKATEKAKPAEDETTSSGEDYEHQRTLEIINRLSLKYLKPSTKASPVQRRVTRSSPGFENKSASVYDYDADEDTTSDDNSRPSKLQLALSPIKKGKSKPKSKTVAKKSVTQPVGKRKPAKSSTSRAYQPVPVASKRRRGSGSTIKGTSSDLLSTVEKKRKVSWGSVSQGDSGVFMSPPSRILSTSSSFTKTSTPGCVQASTSTPNEPVKRKSDSGLSTSCFGFSSGIASPQLELSPVKRVLTPRNDVPLKSYHSNVFSSTDRGSPNLKGGKSPRLKFKKSPKIKFNKSASTYSKPTPPAVASVESKPLVIGSGLYDIPMTAPAKRTKLKKERESIVTKRIEDMAVRINAEFDEIEMFELSIEG